jgi:hypothetical protein
VAVVVLGVVVVAVVLAVAGVAGVVVPCVVVPCVIVVRVAVVAGVRGSTDCGRLQTKTHPVSSRTQKQKRGVKLERTALCDACECPPTCECPWWLWPVANIPTKFTASPSELTTSSCDVFISGGSSSRWIASNTMKIEIKHRKRPLAKPDRVSTREYLQSQSVSAIVRVAPWDK